jgi:hypothetical protein
MSIPYANQNRYGDSGDNTSKPDQSTPIASIHHEGNDSNIVIVKNRFNWDRGYGVRRVNNLCVRTVSANWAHDQKMTVLTGLLGPHDHRSDRRPVAPSYVSGLQANANFLRCMNHFGKAMRTRCRQR